jgi:hypothetical protein
VNDKPTIAPPQSIRFTIEEDAAFPGKVTATFYYDPQKNQPTEMVERVAASLCRELSGHPLIGCVYICKKSGGIVPFDAATAELGYTQLNHPTPTTETPTTKTPT